jgi:hypothetical protein
MKTENNINEQELVLLKDGIYQAEIIKKHRTMGGYYTDRLMLIFKVKDKDKYYEIAKYYQIKYAKTPMGKSGRFLAKARGDLMFDFFKILPDHKRVRNGEVPMSKLKGKMVEVSIRTVTKNYKKQTTSKSMFYSVIDEILRVL